MNRTEREKIYRLLSNFYPNAKQLQSRETLTAYGLALERFTYEDVKTAVVDYAMRNKFFPDLSDLLSGLTPEATRPAAGETDGRMAELLERVFDKPRHLCHVLVAGRATGGTFGDMLARFAPASCLDCPKQSGCPHAPQPTKGSD